MTHPHIYTTVQGYFTFPNFYNAVARNHDDSATIVEVGTFYGQSIIYLAEVCRILGKKPTIYGVDPFEGSPELADHSKDDLKRTYYANIEPFTDLIKHIELPSIQAAKHFDDESIDLVFIDGAHDFDSVYNDILAWLPKVKTGGIVSGHDWEHPDVQRAVTQVFGKHATPIGERVWIAER
jgi:predicted O-methyltransferase YrrM